MKLRVRHQTLYHYDTPVRNAVQSLRLMPSQFDGQKVMDWAISITDGQRGPCFRDGAGDWIEGWTVRGPVSQIEVLAEGWVETTDTAGVLRGHREQVPPTSYLTGSSMTAIDEGLTRLAQEVEGDDTLSLAHALSTEVRARISYQGGVTEMHTSAAEALALGEGVCQDHAHALIAVARVRGIAARYVSGYLFTTSDGQSHPAAHAWAELYIPDLGWVGFDAANRCCPDERYVRTGSGIDARDAAPVRGVYHGRTAERMTTAVAVELLDA